MTVLDTGALERLRRIGGAELVQRMIALFLENGPPRVLALQDGTADRDPAAVERAAHTLKSSAGNVGAERLRRVAEALEAQAAAGSVDSGLVTELVREYDEAAAALRRALEEHAA